MWRGPDDGGIERRQATHRKLYDSHLSPHVPLRWASCRRENGFGLARDADAFVVLRPYFSLAPVSDQKGRALLLRPRGSEFRFLTEAPGQPTRIPFEMRRLYESRC